MKQIVTAAGVIVNHKGEILCTKRDVGKYDYVSLKWEFPGGKIEEGETPRQTLERELREELNIKVEIGEFYYHVEHDYPDFHLSMAVFKCKFNEQEISMNVHKEIMWMKPQDMMQLDWAAADIPVAQKVFSEAKSFQK